MASPAIVEPLDVVHNLTVRLAAAVERLTSDQLLLERRKEALDGGNCPNSCRRDSSSVACAFSIPTSGEVKWTGSRVDLVFGSNSLLRAIAEV